MIIINMKNIVVVVVIIIIVVIVVIFIVVVVVIILIVVVIIIIIIIVAVRLLLNIKEYAIERTFPFFEDIKFSTSVKRWPVVELIYGLDELTVRRQRLLSLINVNM